MEPNWTKALKISISDTLSTMYFMVPEDNPDMMKDLSDDSGQAWCFGWVVVKSGGQAIKVWVCTPEHLGRELAANILSTDADDLSVDDLEDAFKELLNMVVGGLLTNVDSTSQWQMGLPEISMLSGGMLGKSLGGSEKSMAFDLDGMPLLTGWIRTMRPEPACCNLITL